MATHADLTGTHLHESKGFSAASNNTRLIKNELGVSEWKPDSELGSTGASAKQIFVADGANEGSWQSFAIGSVSSMHITTLLAIIGSGAVDVLINTVEIIGVVGAGLVEMSVGTDGLLQYTGTLSRHFHIACTISITKAVGTGNTTRCILYHEDNSAGTTLEISHSEIRCEANTSFVTSTALHSDIMMDTNDKLILAVQNIGGSNDISLVTYYLFALGTLGV